MASCPYRTNGTVIQNNIRGSSLLQVLCGVHGGLLSSRWLSVGHWRAYSRVQSTGTTLQPQQGADASVVASMLPEAAPLSHTTAEEPPSTRRQAPRARPKRSMKVSAQEQIVPEDSESSSASDHGASRDNRALQPSLEAAGGTADARGATVAGVDAEGSPARHRARGPVPVALEPEFPVPVPGFAVGEEEALNDSPSVASGRGRGGGSHMSEGGAKGVKLARVIAAVTSASEAADAAAAATMSPSMGGRASFKVSSQSRIRSRLFQVEPSTNTNAVHETGATAPGDEDSDGGGSSSSVSLGPENLSAARARVLQIKAALFHNMRSETRAPSADSVKLIFAPVETQEGTEAVAEPLRAEPLRPPPPIRERLLRPATALAQGKRLSSSGNADADVNGELSRARRRRAAEMWSTLRLGEQRRRERQQQQQRRWREKEEEGRDLGSTEGGLTDRRQRSLRERKGDVRESRDGSVDGSVSPRRVIKPLEMRRSDAAEAAAQRFQPQKAAVSRAAAGGSADVAAETEIAQTQRARMQRANEEFVRYIEGVAAEAESKGDRSGGAEPEQEWRQQREKSVLSPLVGKGQRREEDEARKAQMSQQRRQQQQEQANLLRDLANMFRSFARQAQPAGTAAAAVVAAVSPATAAAAAAATAAAHMGTASEYDASRRGRGAGSGSSNPLAGFLGLGRPNDVQLILKPLTGRKLTEAEACAVGDGEEREQEQKGRTEGGGMQVRKAEGLHVRPLPTRGMLLRLLRPMAKARLPPYTRSIGLRISRQRRPRMLGLRVVAPAEALDLVGDGARMSGAALRALRRRTYFYRQVAPQRRRAALAAAAGDPHQQRGHAWESGEQGGVLAGVGEEASEVEAEAPLSPLPRPRPYSLSGGSFVVKRRAQYSDTLKRTARQAALDKNAEKLGSGTSTAVAVATAAASSEAEEGEAEPRGEYNSAAEIVNDMYEQIMGVRLPERAMYGRRAEALASLTSSRVKEQTKSWIEACGKEYALAFHAREPLLLTTPAPTMLLSLEHLSRVFGLPPDECVQLALRNPSFIGLPHAQLQSTVNAVSEVLDIGLQEAGKVVMKCPGLAVRQPEFPVARRVELLGALLPVSKDKLRQMVRQRPQLLSKSPQSLASFMISVSTTLSMPLFDVSLMIAGM
ncbi:hypothetical protein Vretifemale_9011 [Volvox reticuliferus]|uniref:Uncharacterized protein n=3 Tax=Volvox reticuliferus TaxID=1737510 RepID=A0A8J4CF25_9CHLO|nr:hypothetical protein Vretifemale_9011 [Volvox reticuliferus]